MHWVWCSSYGDDDCLSWLRQSVQPTVWRSFSNITAIFWLTVLTVAGMALLIFGTIILIAFLDLNCPEEPEFPACSIGNAIAFIIGIPSAAIGGMLALIGIVRLWKAL